MISGSYACLVLFLNEYLSAYTREGSEMVFLPDRAEGAPMASPEKTPRFLRKIFRFIIKWIYNPSKY